MILDYTMRQAAHPLYKGDSTHIPMRGEFVSREAFQRFVEHERYRGWLVENARAVTKSEAAHK